MGSHDFSHSLNKKTLKDKRVDDMEATEYYAME
jgi:hypothetical protein